MTGFPGWVIEDGRLVEARLFAVEGSPDLAHLNHEIGPLVIQGVHWFSRVEDGERVLHYSLQLERLRTEWKLARLNREMAERLKIEMEKLAR